MHKQNQNTEKKTRTVKNLSASFALDEKTVGTLAVRALLYEVSATPKPGLVDRENNGAHRDMCFETFLDSAGALRSCFEECALAGMNAQTVNADLAKSLRDIGLDGEKAMFSATGGVNTHKGLIFSMGIVSTACGFLAGSNFDRADLQKLCGEIATELLGSKADEEEYTDKASDCQTHGETVYRKTGIGGVRAEALSGFASAFSIGLPSLEQMRKSGIPVNSAMVYTLIRLMAETDDSNIVYRGGLSGLKFVKESASELLSEEDFTGESAFDRVRELDRQCIERNLSPGGCADLLAISVMLYFIFNRKL